VRVLLIGGGGREHAIGWKLTQSSLLDGLISLPGNPGLASLGAVVPADPTDPDEVLSVALANAVDLVVVGPEAPLAAGVVDVLADVGVPAFGPTSAGARLESSKAYAKDVMRRAGVPTAASRSFTDIAAAETHIDTHAAPYVVKADGLAAGKGVLVTPDADAAKAWARLCLAGGFGPAGETVVIEEHLDGREVSVFAICDGTTAVPLAPARDYKRLRDGDIGPNTGGMGSFSPVADLPADLVADTMKRVIAPVLATLHEEGVAYRGFLYVGLMLTEEGPQVLEFNCRLGDPETQVVLPRLEGDLVAILADAAGGTLADEPLRWRETAAVDVVLAAPGYPEAPETGAPIDGLDIIADRSDVLVFHAGTRLTHNGLVTAGGRVLNVVGVGPDVASARQTAYTAAEQIHFEGKHVRKDIGE